MVRLNLVDVVLERRSREQADASVFRHDPGDRFCRFCKSPLATYNQTGACGRYECRKALKRHRHQLRKAG
jgi:hypothetical protein